MLLVASYYPDAPNSPWVPQNHRDLRVRPLQRIRVRPLHMRVQERLGTSNALVSSSFLVPSSNARSAPLFSVRRGTSSVTSPPRCPDVARSSVGLVPATHKMKPGAPVSSARSSADLPLPFRSSVRAPGRGNHRHRTTRNRQSRSEEVKERPVAKRKIVVLMCLSQGFL